MSPEPEVTIPTFWFAFALNWIVPELSLNTCCPLTYNDPGPIYTSFHTLVALPSECVLLAAGSKFAPKPVPPAVLSKNASFTAKLTAPELPPPDKPLPAVTALISPVSDILNCPELADKPDPAIALTKSATLSFLLPFESSASIRTMLSFATFIVAAVNSFKSNAMLNAQEVPPPLKPSPAVTAVMSPISEYFASLCPPAVEPSWTLMVSKSVSTVISPTSPVNELCWAVVPLLHWIAVAISVSSYIVCLHFCSLHSRLSIVKRITFYIRVFI